MRWNTVSSRFALRGSIWTRARRKGKRQRSQNPSHLNPNKQLRRLAQMRKKLLKLSSWVTLALCAECATPEVGDQCSVACDLIKDEISSSEDCAKSRMSLPRPKIGRVCKEGFDEAFALTCAELCSSYGTSRAVPSHIREACDKRKREVPRPVAHKACLDGFKAGLAATTTLVNEKIEAMDEDARATLIETNLSKLEEADARRRHSKDASEAREIERTKQKEEEQQRARNAVEEKSAEVRREKEALSRKQEQEAARAAEEAERRSKQSVEDRQVRIEAAADVKEVEGEPKPGSTLPSSTAVESPTSMANAQAPRDLDGGFTEAAVVSGDALSRKPLDNLEQERSGAGPQDLSDALTVQDASHNDAIQMKFAEDLEPVTANAESMEGLLVREVDKESSRVGDLEANASIEDSARAPSHREDRTGEDAQVTGAPSHSQGSVQAAAAAAENELRGEDKVVVDLRHDPRYREVLKAENVEGFDTQFEEKDEAPQEHAATARAERKETNDVESRRIAAAGSRAEEYPVGVETGAAVEDTLVQSFQRAESGATVDAKL